VLLRLDHVASFIVDAYHSVMRLGSIADTPHMTLVLLPFNVAMLAAQIRDTGYLQVCYRRNRF
jgi:hypothetical protein